MALYAASSSSSAPFPPKKYDVFISFRGEDTRSNFTSHLQDAFCRKNIQTYIDYRLQKGDEISSALMQAIEDSYVSMVIFSENYASSKWCLDELAHILHCKRVQGQFVIPVFYEVDPSHVRHQTGTYKKAFEKHELDLKHSKHKMHKWRVALTEVASLAGWNSLTFRDDFEFIQKIVQDILQKLNHKYPTTGLKGLVGIENNFAHIELLLRKVHTIGIWGIGGIGKTTIAQALFSKYSSQYEGCCFLAKVRENSGKQGSGLYKLRHILFSALLGEENLQFGTSVMESTFVKRRLSCKKVFIVLDNVSALEQLEYLALDGECHCFGPGSRILITTRDKHVLSKGVDEIYEVKKLEFQESLKLFSLNAFNQNLPIVGYEELSKKIVVYAKGIPLALKVLGSFLRGKGENEWNSELRKLAKIPHEDIQKVLRLSYDGLNYEEKQIFLDIACFFKGWFKEDVISLLDNFGFYGAIGIITLQDKALIIENNQLIEMHNLIQEMGWEIVREESIKEPGRRSRMWNSEEVCDVLTNNKGSDEVEGILLNECGIKDIHLCPDIFIRLPNLRFLQLYSPNYVKSSKVHLQKGLDFLPNKIRYLEWHGCPLKSLPSAFCPEKLVQLCMPDSHVQKLWNGVQDLVNLEVIDLSGSKMLMELPDFSKAFKLEKVFLPYCESLHYVHSSILSLHSLVELDLWGCTKLESLKSEIHLTSLKYLCVDYCLNLKEFSVSSEKISYLDLSQTGTKILHLSTGRSSNLEELCLNGLRLEDLPNELSCLRALTSLDLSDCQVIDDSKLQIIIDGLTLLRELSLNDCSNIIDLPNNIQHLSRLELLFLNNCKGLRSLPKLPPSILFLDANGCTSLEIVMTSRPLNASHKGISFQNCLKLNEKSLHNIIEDAHSAMVGAAYGFKLNTNTTFRPFFESSICLPGSRVPEWFRYQTTQSSIIIELPPYAYILGLVFCVVFHSSTPSFYAQFNCTCYLGNHKVRSFSRSNKWWSKMNSDHVYIWDDVPTCYGIWEVIEGRSLNDQFVTNLKLSLKFVVETYDKKLKPSLIDISIKECGVCPIYASDFQEFTRQMKYKSKFKENNKRRRDVDEEEPLPEFKKLKLHFGTQTNTCLDIDELEALLMRIDIA